MELRRKGRCRIQNTKSPSFVWASHLGTWEEQFVTPQEPRILQIWSPAVSSSTHCTLHLHFHLLTSLLCCISSRYSTVFSSFRANCNAFATNQVRKTVQWNGMNRKRKCFLLRSSLMISKPSNFPWSLPNVGLMANDWCWMWGELGRGRARGLSLQSSWSSSQASLITSSAAHSKQLISISQARYYWIYWQTGDQSMTQGDLPV